MLALRESNREAFEHFSTEVLDFVQYAIEEMRGTSPYLSPVNQLKTRFMFEYLVNGAAISDAFMTALDIGYVPESLHGTFLRMEELMRVDADPRLLGEVEWPGPAKDATPTDDTAPSQLDDFLRGATDRHDTADTSSTPRDISLAEVLDRLTKRFEQSHREDSNPDQFGLHVEAALAKARRAILAAQLTATDAITRANEAVREALATAAAANAAAGSTASAHLTDVSAPSAATPSPADTDYILRSLRSSGGNFVTITMKLEEDSAGDGVIRFVAMGGNGEHATALFKFDEGSVSDRELWEGIMPYLTGMTHT